MGFAATWKFAQYLGVHPNEIRPEWNFELPSLADVDDDTLALFRDYADLNADGRALVDSLIKQLKNSG